MKLFEIKEQQKVLAEEIKKLKKSRKGARDGWVDGLELARCEYRHWHIAYCLARGRTMEQIERTCREDNYPNERLYKSCLDRIELPEPASEEKEAENG